MVRIVSVRDLIPEMNLDGLVWTRWGEKEKDWTYWDKAKDLDLSSGEQFKCTLLRHCFHREGFNFRKLKQLAAFRDQVVVDLGSGGSIATGMEIAEVSGAKSYVAVDLDCSARVWLDEIAPAGLEIPIAFVQEDMLSFLRRLPKGSVSAICSHMDWNILRGDYARKTEEELCRVFHSDGAYLRSWNTIVNPFSENERHIQFGSGSYDLYSRRFTEQPNEARNAQ